MTRSNAIETALETAQKRFNAKFPGTMRVTARKFATERFEADCDGIDHTDTRFTKEAALHAYCLLVDEHARFNSYAA